jgi:hypothetical protein
MNSRLLSALAFTGVLALVVTSGPRLDAQQPVSQTSIVSQTFTIDAIDHTKRIVTLKSAAGLTTDVYCGPQVQRFDALKVGDRVTFQFHESVVTGIHRPGATPKPAETTNVTRNAGAPGGAVTQQMTAVVTLEAIDPKVPSVTLKTKDGHRMSLKVENAKNLEGYKAGDQIEVTYTQALAVSVTPAAPAPAK